MQNKITITITKKEMYSLFRVITLAFSLCKEMGFLDVYEDKQICKELGIITKGEYARHILRTNAFLDKIQKYRMFGRLTPEFKNILTAYLKEDGLKL